VNTTHVFVSGDVVRAVRGGNSVEVAFGVEPDAFVTLPLRVARDLHRELGQILQQDDDDRRTRMDGFAPADELRAKLELPPRPAPSDSPGSP
jgi:hypothetical protein